MLCLSGVFDISRFLESQGHSGGIPNVLRRLSGWRHVFEARTDDKWAS